MNLRDAPKLYEGKINDDDTYKARERQDSMKEMIRQQILENRRAREDMRRNQDNINQHDQYSYQIRERYE